MTNKLEQFLEKQINSGNIDWESKSKLIRTSGEKINANTTKIVKSTTFSPNDESLKKIQKLVNDYK